MSNAIARQQPTSGTVLATVLEQARDRLAAALPAHLTPERTAQLLSVIAYRTPDLARCMPESIVTSLIQVGNLDLDFSPGTNEAHLVPRWNGKAKALECTFMPGYKGLEKIAIRTGAVRYIQPRVVYEGDDFEVWHEDDRTHYRHRPLLKGDRGKVTHYYAVARMADGSPLIEVMTAEEVEAIHQRTEGYRKSLSTGEPERGPWVTDYDSMGCKTVIRKTCKSLPRVASSPAAIKAFQQLDAAIEADNAHYVDWQQLEAPTKPQNNSGYGQGMYASPEQSEAFEKAMKGFLAKVNNEWLDRLDRLCRGDVPEQIRELNEYQADAHLLKWAVETGRLDPSIVPEDAKVRQRYRFTAIVYHRTKDDRKAITQELARYAEQHWHRQLDALTRLRPDLAEAINGQFGEPEEQAEDAADPEFDYEPGSDG